MSQNNVHHIIKDDKRPVELGSRGTRLAKLVADVERLHRSQPVKALKYSKEALHLADQLGDKRSKFELLLCLGRIEARKGRLETAEERLREALGNLPGRRSDKDSLCKTYLAIGAVYYLQQKNQLALECYSQALACNVEKYKVNLYLNIANLYFTNANFGKSLQYQRRALRLARVQNDLEHQIFCLSNIGAIFVKSEKLERALQSFEEALRMINMHQGNDYMRCSCELNLGEVHFRLDHIQKAEAHYKEAIRLAKLNQFDQELAKAYQYVAVLKSKEEDHKSFLHYLYRSRKLAQQNNFESIQIDVLRLLQHYFEDNKDFKKAYAFLKEMDDVQANIEQKKQQKELSQLLNAKDKEISILEKQRDQIEEQRHRLERNNRELEQNNRDLEQYAFVVAHDLKEPLRNISSFTSLIEQRYTSQLDDTAREYMQFVVQNSGRMNTLLTELLRYTTLRRQTKNSPGEIQVEQIIQQVVSDLGLRIKEKNAVIYLGEMPSVMLPFDHVYQLFFNLIDNALQFNHSEAPEIHIAAELKDSTWQFSVRDNGIGIEKSYQEKIFKLFQRLDREHYSGTGIGLALCRKIVHLYEGEIWLTSEPGQGSTFFFTLKD